MDQDIKVAIDALDYVLDFSSKMILRTLEEKKPYSEAEMSELRKNCDILKDRDLYPFDITLPDGKLLEQVQEFVKKGLETSE